MPDLTPQGVLDVWRFWTLAPLAVLIAGIAKSGFGSGLGLLAVPTMIAAVWVPASHSPDNHIQLAWALMLPMLILSDYAAMAYCWKQWDSRLVWRMVPGSLLGITLAWAAFSALQTIRGGLMSCMGTLAILMVLLPRFTKPARQIAPVTTTRAAIETVDSAATSTASTTTPAPEAWAAHQRAIETNAVLPGNAEDAADAARPTTAAVTQAQAPSALAAPSDLAVPSVPSAQSDAVLRFGRGRAVAFGALAGFTSMIGHAAGPITAAALLPLELPKAIFVGTCAYFFFVVNQIKLLPMADLGLVREVPIWTQVAFVPLVIAGTTLGRFLQARTPQALFNRVVVVTVAVSGCLLIALGLLGF